jgi:hypothetical protein
VLRGPDFRRFVIDPAVLEVNGLSDIGVELALNRRSQGAPIESVTVAWSRKQGDDFRAVKRELNRSKIGRMARLRGDVEEITPVASIV